MAYRFNLPLDSVGDGIDDFAGALIYVYEFGTTTAKTTYADFALTTPNTDPVVADANGLFADIFVDVQCSMELQTSAAVQVYTADVYAPEDGITSLAAVDVTLTDTGGFYTATDVEAALAEIGADMSLGNAQTMSADLTFSGADLQMADNLVVRPQLTDYAITVATVSDDTGTTTLDLTLGNVFTTTLTADTTIALSNPPATGIYGEVLLITTQDATGGWTVTWPASVVWPAGGAPTITTAIGGIDEVSLHTTDFGTTWFGNYSQAFS